MFVQDGILFRSTLFADPRICHGFSTRLGGVSTHPYTRSMNLAMGREDDDDTVRRNGEIFTAAVTNRELTARGWVSASQIHSTKVRIVTETNVGEGLYIPAGEDCDGFVTDIPGVLPVIRVADCTPILLFGTKADGSPVVGAVHAGWRGSAGGIVWEAVEKLVLLGAVRERIQAAIGAHIGTCCYEVGADLLESVTAMAGEAFAHTYCVPRCVDEAGIHKYGIRKYTADLTGMNLHWLAQAGVDRSRVDVAPHCTMCDPDLFHSHRATGGKRGAMAAMIGILP